MNKVYEGTVKSYNGHFGFLKSELGETYFHKSGIADKIIIDRSDEVKFMIELSPKKEGSFQAYNIILIKEFDKPLVDLVNPGLGIIKWFNDAKGFGIIGTPEKVDYFLHRSNIYSNNLRPRIGDIIIFEEKIEKGKKTASHCKELSDYKDFEIALGYLSKENTVILEEKIAERGHRGKVHYSIKNKEVSLIQQAVFQILKDKTIEDRLKYISDYFLSIVSFKSSEEQLHYFSFVKSIFENNLKKDKSLILTSFFSHHSDYLINHTDFKFSLWLEGYTQETDLSIIAKQITKESTSSFQNPIKKVFEKLREPSEQEVVLNQLLELFGSIDNKEKYSRIKSLAGSSELDENVKEGFLKSSYDNSDLERQYLMWLEGYTQEKDLGFIAKQITKESIGSYFNPFKKIFGRLEEPTEQNTVLHNFLKLFGSIDNAEKYSRVKYFSGLPELDKKVKKAFWISVYGNCDIERQYLMWLEGYTQEKDLSIIAKQITKELISSFQNLIKKVFEKLREPSEQEVVLNQLLELFGSIDNEEKYCRIKSLTVLSELDEKVKERFLKSSYGYSDLERQYLMWLEGYTQEKDLSFIAKQITKESIGSYYNPFKKIFERLEDPTEQNTLLKIFLEIFGSIDNPEKYSRIKSLSGLPELDKKVKKAFLISVYGHCDLERQYLMWLEGYSQEKDLRNIANQITKESIRSNNNSFKKIFEKLENPTEQDIVLKEFLELIGIIDNDRKYMRTKYLASELEENEKEKFQSLVFNNSNVHYQVKLFLDYFQFREGEKQQLIVSLFNRLDIASFFTFCTELLNPLAKINTHYYHRGFSYLKIFLIEKEYIKETNNRYGNTSIFSYQGILLNESHFETKIYFFKIISSYILNNINTLRTKGKEIIETGDLDLISKLLTALHNYKSTLVPICSDLEIKESDIFSVESFIVDLLNSPRFQNSVETNVKEIIETGDFDLISKLLATLHNYKSTLVPICSDLEIEESIILRVESFIVDLLNSKRFQDLVETNAKEIIETGDFDLISKFLTTFHDYKSTCIQILAGLEIKESIIPSIESFIVDLLNSPRFQNSVETNAKEIIETGDYDLISKFLKQLNSHKSDFQIEESSVLKIESYIVDLGDTSQLLKLWVYDLIDYFNFNTYCYYYFTLSLQERKLFNKKAKAKMGEEIKTSMLKKKEPWKFVEKTLNDKNLEVEYYTATWKSIWFGDGFIRICIDNEPSFSQQFKWHFSEEKFNLLHEYISGKRLNELKITAIGDLIKSIENLDDLEELIWKILIIQEVETSNGTTIRGVGTNKIPVNMLLRNQCIQLLNNFQLKELEPTRVLEKTFNLINGGIGVDISLLYSIPINEYEVAIIWESLELEKAKATHIFKCNRSEFKNIFSEIENYLSGNLKVRSTLNSKEYDDIGHQKKLRYLCRIEHDNFNFSKWENSLYEILPELKTMALIKE